MQSLWSLLLCLDAVQQQGHDPSLQRAAFPAMRWLPDQPAGFPAVCQSARSLLAADDVDDLAACRYVQQANRPQGGGAGMGCLGAWCAPALANLYFENWGLGASP